jgi:protein TonB
MRVGGMAPRKPTAVVVVCAAHAVLGWALLSLGTDRMPSSVQAVPQEGLRLVPVRLVSALSTVVTAPVAPQVPQAAQAVRTPPPVRQFEAADIGRAAAPPGLAPSQMDTATDATAEPLAPAAAPVAGTAMPERQVSTANVHASSAPAAPEIRVTTRSESPPVVMAQADRRQCPPAPHPAALRERGIEGAVVLRVKVDMQGRPADVQLLAGSGWRLFDEAALQQVRACRFIPATQGGQAIDSWVEFPVRFALAG